ncbi:MAG: hypothetical protein P1U46_02935 [Patescibacteria group bacterium]|nr:hypothetical protein [Patescibacteria group bacterium]
MYKLSLITYFKSISFNFSIIFSDFLKYFLLFITKIHQFTQDITLSLPKEKIEKSQKLQDNFSHTKVPSD